MVEPMSRGDRINYFVAAGMSRAKAEARVDSEKTHGHPADDPAVMAALLEQHAADQA